MFLKHGYARLAQPLKISYFVNLLHYDMKTNQLLIIAILMIAFSCQNADEKNTTETVEIVNEEPVSSNVINDSEIVETESIDTELLEFGWKTDADYIHFGASYLDTVYIGAERAIKDPFEYFSEERNNVVVLIDSGRYVDESALWISGDNIIVCGEDGVSILIDQLYDNVMWVTGNNIVVDNLHMMHLMRGDESGQNCTGRVIGFEGADNVTIVNCDLNGCGLAGLHDNMMNGTIYVEHNYIHNNSLGAYTNIDGEVWQEEVDDHETFIFKNNRIENNGFDRIFEYDEEYTEGDFN